MTLGFWRFQLLMALLSFGLLGCTPYSPDPQDEQKETYYIAGKKHLQNMDHEGAREMFEKAVEANPRSASAHFELGVLNENHFSNYVAAIYHYRKHLDIRPQSEISELVRARIRNCELEIGKSVNLGVASREVQRELDRLNQENQNLKRQVEALRVQLASKPMVITNYVQVPQMPAAGMVRQGNAEPPPVIREQPSANRQPPSIQGRAATTRSHVVKSGETMASIARIYGVSPAAVQAANPGVDPRRMRPGTALRIPPR